MGKLGLVLCVLLACVAPTMAADWYQVPLQGESWQLALYNGYNYNPDPLQTDIDYWWDVVYQPPFYAGPPDYIFGEPPWYEPNGFEVGLTSGPGGTLDFSAYEIRQNLITATYWLGCAPLGNMSIGTLCIGDSWWPMNYDNPENPDNPMYTGWTNQTIRQGDWYPSGDIYIEKVKFGHDQSEFELPAAANNAIWEIHNGKGESTLTVDEWHVISPQTVVTVRTNKGVNNCILTTGRGARPEWGGNPDTLSVTIGDIYLNEHPLVFDCTAGVWNITGDVDLEPNALDGNMVFLLTGDVESYTETVQTGHALLNIHESVLDKMIAEGYLWIRGGNYYNRIWPVIDRGRWIDINVMDPSDNGGRFIPDYYQTYRQITPATKDHWLKVTDTDGAAGDMVSVHVVGYHYQDQYKEYAWSPNYPNGAWAAGWPEGTEPYDVVDPNNVVLEWSAGDSADLHRVYFAKALRSDLNKSGNVDIEDFEILTDYWLTNGTRYKTDSSWAYSEIDDADPNTAPQNGYADPNTAPNAANIAEPIDICNLADFAVMAEEWGQDYLEQIGTTTDTSFIVSTPASPLELGVTYVWRVDEVDTDTSPETIYTGRVWNFRLNKYDASVEFFGAGYPPPPWTP